MANLPIRGLGSVGVVTDVDPYNLPIGGFTRAKNVRFNEGKVTAGPIYRKVSDPVAWTPMFSYGLTSSSGYDTVLVVDDFLNIHEFANGNFTTVHTGSVSSPSTEITATTLADVVYINRSDTQPLHRTRNASTFTTLPNWPSNILAGSIRSYGDFLIALGTTEGGTAYPNRVRFSNPALANSVPSTWDETDTTASAGFNDLVQMKTPIIDGQTLGSNFLVYSQDQVWMMEFVGGTFIFNFRKVFDDAGVINKNCVIEVEGKHYVFDRDDIYMTDGNTRQSICDGRVREYIFSGIDYSKYEKCFVIHNTDLEEIYFCYHSGDDMAIYTDGDACNRAAVYNYKEDLWTFQDLPNVVSGAIANVNTVQSFATVTGTYATIGGSFHSQESQYGRHILLVSNTTVGVPDSRIYGLDLVDEGSLSTELDAIVSQPVFLERVGIDLDEQGIPLTGYKVISKITPQISTPNADGNFRFTFGAATIPTSAPNYSPTVTFDALVDYKVDTRIAGRYLSYKLTSEALKDFAFSGMDVEVAVTGRR